MSWVNVYLDAIGVCGPGLPGWTSSRDILRGDVQYLSAPTSIASSDYLPAAERRRVGAGVKLALATAKDAFSMCSYEPSMLASVFSSSGGDGDNCHMICEALASSDRLISPTRFTNSVHNAPSGYWGIALNARPASTSLCAFDGSFSAGLLEAATQSIAAGAPVLLVAYDTPYPEPLNATRPIPHSMGVAMVINSVQAETTLTGMRISLGKGKPDTVFDPELEALRCSVPAARCLPLLEVVACNTVKRQVVLDMFENQQLILELGG
jgi:Beta-ketoacyl synthase, N-terminal domain